MKVLNTKIPDVKIIIPDVFEDSRGYFFEAFNEEKFNNIVQNDVNFVQCNESKSSHGVVRGLHYQAGDFAQGKLVRVVCGKVLDVAVDIRKGSPTFGMFVSAILSGENKNQLWIPRGFAHGFSVLSDTVIFQYYVDNIYNKESERGILFNDPNIGIDWMIKDKDFILSEKDMLNPPLSEAKDLFIYKDLQ